MARRHQYVLCVRNRGYLAALEVRKVYRTVPDEAARRHGLVRVVDESGEDYLYPQTYFLPIEVPEEALRVFAKRPA